MGARIEASTRKAAAARETRACIVLLGVGDPDRRAWYPYAQFLHSRRPTISHRTNLSRDAAKTHSFGMASEPVGDFFSSMTLAQPLRSAARPDVGGLATAKDD